MLGLEKLLFATPYIYIYLYISIYIYLYLYLYLYLYIYIYVRLSIAVPYLVEHTHAQENASLCDERYLNSICDSNMIWRRRKETVHLPYFWSGLPRRL